MISRFINVGLTLGMLVTLSVPAQDMCSTLLKQGYYDENRTFTSQRNFEYLQKAFCSDSSMTFQRASSASGSGGVNVISLFDATLSGSTSSSNFESRRNAFCSADSAASSADARVVQTTRTVSVAAMNLLTSCANNKFSVLLTPKSTGDGFGVTVRNDTGDVTVLNISGGAPNIIQCDSNFPKKVSPPFSFNCTKPREKTVLITANIEGRGSMEPVELAGTDQIIPQIQSEMRTKNAAFTAQLAQMQRRMNELDQDIVNSQKFGGVYSVEDNGCPQNVTSDSRTNPVTGSLGCPTGFTAEIFARVKGAESGCGVSEYVCKK